MSCCISHKAEVVFCRGFQLVLKVGNYFMGYRMPKYMEGPGKVKELGQFMKEKGLNDVLVVTGSSMMRCPIMPLMKIPGSRWRTI